MISSPTLLTILSLIVCLGYFIYKFFEKNGTEKKENHIQISEQIKYPKDIETNENTIIYVKEKEPVEISGVETNNVDITFINLDNKLANEQMYDAQVVNENNGYENYFVNPLPSYSKFNSEKHS